MGGGRKGWKLLFAGRKVGPGPLGGDIQMIIRTTRRVFTWSTAIAALSIGLISGVGSPAQAQTRSTNITGQASLNPATAATNTYTLKNINSGKCLDVAYGGRADFNQVVQYT